MTTKPAGQGVSNDQIVLAQLKSLGFSDAYVPTPRRLVASVSGKAKKGKSHFAFTGPPPIVLIDIDVGTEGVVGKFQDEGKYFLRYAVRVPKEAPKDVWSHMWQDLKQRVKKVYEIKSGTVVWDTSSEAYELCRLAEFGRLTDIKPSDYTKVNNEWRDVLRMAFDSTANTVFIHKVKDAWGMIPSGSGSRLGKTGKTEIEGFSGMQYLVQVNLIADCQLTDEGPVFSMFVEDCRQNMSIAGTLLEGPMCNFDFLLNLVHGEEK